MSFNVTRSELSEDRLGRSGHSRQDVELWTWHPKHSTKSFIAGLQNANKRVMGDEGSGGAEAQSWRIYKPSWRGSTLSWKAVGTPHVLERCLHESMKLVNWEGGGAGENSDNTQVCSWGKWVDGVPVISVTEYRLIFHMSCAILPVLCS